MPRIGCQNTMGRGVNISLIGDRYTMGRKLGYTMDRVVKVPWVGGQNTMSRGVNIPCVGGSIYHG